MYLNGYSKSRKKYHSVVLGGQDGRLFILSFAPWPFHLSLALSLAALPTTFRQGEVALSAEWPAAQLVFIHEGSASGTERSRDDAR